MLIIIFKCGREQGCNFRGAVSVCEMRLSVNIAEGSLETFYKPKCFTPPVYKNALVFHFKSDLN